MRLYPVIAALILVFIIAACSILQAPTVSVPMAEGVDTVAVEIDIPQAPVRSWVVPDRPEQFLRPRTWDLQHQKIWVRFDFSEEAVLGETELFLTSISSQNQQLVLDAKTMDIHEITNIRSGQLLDITQDSSTVTIQLSDTFSTGDSLFVRITYTAYPPSRGLYFVNPDGSDPDKPTQIWTLGQPEDNSFWLPTIDHPAERATQETWIAVPDRFQTLSNGALLDSRILPGDSLRTDYWKMSLPHAPYLFALAVGEYTIDERFREGVVLKYYVEPQFAPYAEHIYRDTEDMLRFFSSRLNVPYPWSFYAQAPVRDFIASGMENTTASFYFNAIQLTERQAMDVNFQDLIAHELIHQWFGNLVTCKDWANLPINEGFANYFETLYRDHRNGFDSALWKTVTDRDSYFSEASVFRRPIITNRYFNPEDMYDRHTYEKTGLVLRMLHHKVGDQHWWGALNRFLEVHAFSAVDWTDVSRAFEQETGMVLRPFFEQWFTSIGHPTIEVSTWYADNKGYVRLRQTQDMEFQPLFSTTIDIHYFDEIGQQHIRTVSLTTSDSTFVFDDSAGKLGELVVDPFRVVLAEYEEDLTPVDLISRLAHPSVALRAEAVSKLQAGDMISDMIDMLIEAYRFEQVPELRDLLFKALAPHLREEHKEFIHSITFETESFYRVRIRAADVSADLFGISANPFLQNLLEDPSYFVETHIDRMIDVDGR